METLNFVHNISWDEIANQHKPNNWRMEVVLHLPIFPVYPLAKARVYSNLYNLCDNHSTVHVYSSSSARSKHSEGYARALEKLDLPELDQIITEAMKHPQEFPDSILYLGGDQGFPDRHPVFCLRSGRPRRLLLITAFPSLEQCYLFLKTIIQQRWVALLGESVKIRSLTASKDIKPSKKYADLTEEEWNKVLKTHHPRLLACDPTSEKNRLVRTRELVPRLQITLVILWVVCCSVLAVWFAPTWQKIKLPCILAIVAVALQCCAAILSVSVCVHRRVILKADWPGI